MSARAAVLVRNTLRAPRLIRSGDHHGQAMGESIPFSTGPKHKVKTAVYVFGYLGLGFAAPFLAAKYALWKGGRPCKW